MKHNFPAVRPQGGSIVVEARRADVLKQLDRLRVEIAGLRASRKRLVLAHDAERRAIERDLHEGVQQHLVAIAANLQLAAGLVDSDPAAGKTSLDELGRDVQLALADAGKLAQRIYPPLLEAGGLAAALRSAAVSLDVPTRIDVEAPGAYPPEVARAVYFCCLEVLERAAGGAQAAVTVRDEEGALSFEVVADSPNSDLELGGLRDRIEAFGGRLTIRSKTGHGTQVAGSVPFPR
jgi:signal transduction histidine kinase